MEKLASFAFTLGQLMGNMHNPEITQYLNSRGLSEHEIKCIIENLKSLSNTLYREEMLNTIKYINS